MGLAKCQIFSIRFSAYEMAELSLIYVELADLLGPT